MLLFSSMTASAVTESDPEGDIYHYRFSEGTWSWGLSGESKPNIDITEVTFSSSENQVIMTMTVSGIIETSETIGYIVWGNTSDSSYFLSWHNGISASLALNTEEGSMSFDYDPDVVVSDNTITATYNV